MRHIQEPESRLSHPSSYQANALTISLSIANVYEPDTQTLRWAFSNLQTESSVPLYIHMFEGCSFRFVGTSSQLAIYSTSISRYAQKHFLISMDIPVPNSAKRCFAGRDVTLLCGCPFSNLRSAILGISLASFGDNNRGGGPYIYEMMNFWRPLKKKTDLIRKS